MRVDSVDYDAQAAEPIKQHPRVHTGRSNLAQESHSFTLDEKGDKTIAVATNVIEMKEDLRLNANI